MNIEGVNGHLILSLILRETASEFHYLSIMFMSRFLSILSHCLVSNIIFLSYNHNSYQILSNSFPASVPMFLRYLLPAPNMQLCSGGVKNRTEKQYFPDEVSSPTTYSVWSWKFNFSSNALGFLSSKFNIIIVIMITKQDYVREELC